MIRKKRINDSLFSDSRKVIEQLRKRLQKFAAEYPSIAKLLRVLLKISIILGSLAAGAATVQNASSLIKMCKAALSMTGDLKKAGFIAVGIASIIAAIDIFLKTLIVKTTKFLHSSLSVKDGLSRRNDGLLDVSKTLSEKAKVFVNKFKGLSKKDKVVYIVSRLVTIAGVIYAAKSSAELVRVLKTMNKYKSVLAAHGAEFTSEMVDISDRARAKNELKIIIGLVTAIMAGIKVKLMTKRTEA